MFAKRLFSVLFVGFLLLLARSVAAQPAPVSRVVPTPHYYNESLRAFRAGEFNDALKLFDRDYRDRVKMQDANGNPFQWLDSMCYLIMCGECHYQMGRYDDALGMFNMALQIYSRQPNWLASLSSTTAPVPKPRPGAPWGNSNRNGDIGDFSNCKFQILAETVDIINLGRQGTGLRTGGQLTTIHADEIIKRMALMIRRRAEILGPLSKYDPETKSLEELLGGRPHLPNHFTGTWVDVLHGLTLSALADDERAIETLNRGILMQNRYDHQLTAVALNELGNIFLRTGKYEDALKAFYEASISSFSYGDPALLGETIRNMANTQKLFDRAKTFPPLSLAMDYFVGLKDPSPLVTVPLCHELAEDAFTGGNIKGATDLCSRASGAMGRRAIATTVHGARNLYLRAMIEYAVAFENYVGGRPLSLAKGDEHLEQALTGLRQCSLWRYHLFALETKFQQRAITTRGTGLNTRVADEIYEYLLRDPSGVDWALQPMDCLVLMADTPPSAYERWFTVAYSRDTDRAFEISEKARRAKFYSSFRLGPRLLSLRLLFEGDPNEISQEMLLERQTLSLDFERFAKLSGEVRDVKKELLMIPLVPKDPAQSEKQRQLLVRLDQLSLAQEAMLRPIALSRTKAPNVFPPILTMEEIQARLPEKTAILVFVEALGDLYGYMIDRRYTVPWLVTQESRAPSLQTLITNYLDGMGNRDGNRQITVKDLNDPKGKWKKAGNELLRRLLGEDRQVNFTELVVVPTGTLWYVPFEAMTVEVNGEYRPLISAGRDPLTVRYAPMASLALPGRGGRGALGETLVVYGRFQSKSEPTVALDAIDRYEKDGVTGLIPMASMSSDPNYREFPGSASAFATQIRRLLVLDEIPLPLAPLAWTPFMGDRARLNNPVSKWLELPWGGPELIVLPGFHTAAETGVKTQGRGVARGVLNGDDLFLAAMALEACGAKTILISRWRTGGRASFDLVGEFLKNYDNMSAAEAWREAIMNVGLDPLVTAEEPRVRSSAGDPPAVANHPFFWGAFLLIDRGEEALPEEAPPAEAPAAP